MRIPQTPFTDVKYNWNAYHNSKTTEANNYAIVCYMRYAVSINGVRRYHCKFNSDKTNSSRYIGGWAWGVGLRLGRQTK